MGHSLEGAREPTYYLEIGKYRKRVKDLAFLSYKSCISLNNQTVREGQFSCLELFQLIKERVILNITIL